MAYAYSDKYETLHIVDKKETAERYRGNGAIVNTDYPNEGGYPVKDGEHIFVYLNTGAAFIGGNEPPKGKPYDLSADVALSEIMKKIQA